MDINLFEKYKNSINNYLFTKEIKIHLINNIIYIETKNNNNLYNINTTNYFNQLIFEINEIIKYYNKIKTSRVDFQETDPIHNDFLKNQFIKTVPHHLIQFIEKDFFENLSESLTIENDKLKNENDKLKNEIIKLNNQKKENDKLNIEKKINNIHFS
jgi:hypothetical protein